MGFLAVILALLILAPLVLGFGVILAAVLGLPLWLGLVAGLALLAWAATHPRRPEVKPRCPFGPWR